VRIAQDGEIGLRMALEPDPRAEGTIPSTKGTL